MTLNKITKKEAKKIMQTPGKVRGEVFRLLSGYMREKKGEGFLKEVEKGLADLGYPFKFDNAKRLDWYPAGTVRLIYAMKYGTHDWTEKDIVEIGNSMPKISFMAKIYMKYFASPKTIFKIAPRYWRNIYTIGSLEPVKLDEKKKYGIIRLKDFKLHEAHCILLKNAIASMAKLTGAKNVTVQETKCMFKGDPYHEFLIRWE